MVQYPYQPATCRRILDSTTIVTVIFMLAWLTTCPTITEQSVAKAQQNSVVYVGLDERADQAVLRGLDHLWNQVDPRGIWKHNQLEANFPKAQTALAAYTITATSERPYDHRLAVTSKLFEHRSDVTSIYGRSFTLMMWSQLSGTEYWRQIDEDLTFLTGHQNPDGSWGVGLLPFFPGSKDYRDHANSHLALLAATQGGFTGATVNGIIPRRSEKLWLSTANADGGWGYSVVGNDFKHPDPHLLDSFGSMTAAGVDALYMTYDHLYAGAGVPWDTKYKFCRDPHPEKAEQVIEALLRAWAWMDRSFQVATVPGLPEGAYSQRFETKLAYYHFLVGRAANQAGRREIGGQPWAHSITAHLLATQHVDGSWGDVTDTCFAILALREANRPLLINKLAFGTKNDWQRDMRDLPHLLFHYNGERANPATWRVSELTGNAEHLLDAPVLYISGDTMPTISPEAAKALQRHVWSGGTILAVPACESKGFREKFEDTMAALFPTLRRSELPDEHPVWSIRYKVTPGEDVIGYGTKSRTAIFLLNNGACAAWHQNLIDDEARLFDLGVNILEYATFDRPLNSVVSSAPASNETVKAMASIPVVNVQQGEQWASTIMGLELLSERLTRQMSIELNVSAPVEPENIRKTNAKVALITGDSFVSPTGAGNAELKSYAYGGGTVFVSPTCGDTGFDQAFRVWVEELFGVDSLVKLERNDPLLTGSFAPELASSLFNLSYCRTLEGGKPAHIDTPILYGVKLRGRWILIYSPYDVGSGISRHPAVQCIGYEPEDADAIVTNVLLYAALQQ